MSISLPLAVGKVIWLMGSVSVMPKKTVFGAPPSVVKDVNGYSDWKLMLTLTMSAPLRVARSKPSE